MSGDSTNEKTSQPDSDAGITPTQIALAAVILGASAGLTLYTKKTQHVLNQLERASKNATQRKGRHRSLVGAIGIVILLM